MTTHQKRFGSAARGCAGKRGAAFRRCMKQKIRGRRSSSKRRSGSGLTAWQRLFGSSARKCKGVRPAAAFHACHRAELIARGWVPGQGVPRRRRGAAAQYPSSPWSPTRVPRSVPAAYHAAGHSGRAYSEGYAAWAARRQQGLPGI